MKKLAVMLQKECSFSNIFNDKDGNYPKKEMGYIRADHDGYRWYNTCFQVNKDLEAKDRISELNMLYDMFTKEIKNIPDLKEFCYKYGSPVSDTEYNLFYEGKYGNYWFRFITRRGDYNLYLHAYSK